MLSSVQTSVSTAPTVTMVTQTPPVKATQQHTTTEPAATLHLIPDPAVPLRPNPDCRKKTNNPALIKNPRKIVQPQPPQIPDAPIMMTREVYQDMVTNITRAVRNEVNANTDVPSAEIGPVADHRPDQAPRGPGNQNLVREMNTLTLENPVHYYPNPIPAQWRQRQPVGEDNPTLTEQIPPPLIMVDQVSALIEAAKMEMLEAQQRNLLHQQGSSPENEEQNVSQHEPRPAKINGRSHKSKQNKRKHRYSSSGSSSNHSRLRPLGMSRVRRHSRQSRKRRNKYKFSTSSSSSEQDHSHSRSSKIKSGAYRKYSDRVAIRFKWPNEYIGHEDGVSPTYEDMSFTELIFGLIASLLEQLPSHHANRYVRDQLMYLRELFRDATTTSLADTKSCHRRVLEALEKGELDSSNWEEWNDRRKEALNRLHRNVTSSTKNPKAKGVSTSTATRSGKKSRPCTYWNKNACDKGDQDHESMNIIWLHVYSFCFAYGNKYKHRENECQKKISKHGSGPSKGAN